MVFGKGCNLRKKVETVEFFLINTNMTFLAVLYKIDIEGFKNQKIKLPPLGIELTTPSMDYNSSCLTNSANLSVHTNLRLSDPYKVMLY